MFYVCVCVFRNASVLTWVFDRLGESKTEFGQNVNQSRMEQIKKEWLSNHPNHFLFFFAPLLLQSSCAVLARKCRRGECLGWRQGEVTVLSAPGMGG